MKSCYVRGVQVSAKVKKASRHQTEEFLLYSAMSHKWPVRDDKVELIHISPFWSAMLAGREQTHIVNMIPYMEEYIFSYPVAKHHGELKFGSTMSVKMPFLTNKNDLAPGDLLVLPFDGGLAEICCEEFPLIQSSKKGL